MDLNEFVSKADYFSSRKTPFLFIIDFELKKPEIFTLSELEEGPENVKYYIDGKTNYDIKAHPVNQGSPKKPVNIKKFPISKDRYLNAFGHVHENQLSGNSYLLNLTFKTPVKINIPLEDIFYNSRARYKLYFKKGDAGFVSFSPETFVTIQDDVIFTYPIKGTLDSTIKDARQRLLSDKKERAEHLTVVDLLRNDLNIVAEGVMVKRFCSVEEIKTNSGGLLQMYSEIRGTLKKDFKGQIGSMLLNLLPAGSICGAPKKKTLEIIKEAEIEERGYYTGIFGIFDGQNLKSSVLIRYIENIGGNYYYRSGGGITVYSDPLKEYNEMVEKIYVPIY